MNADQWVCDLYPTDPEAAARDERKALVEQVQWSLVEQLLVAKNSVILDWGLWTRAERDHCRQRAGLLGARTELIFLDQKLETLHMRIASRNSERPPGTFHVSADELDEWAALFEPPTPDELRL